MKPLFRKEGNLIISCSSGRTVAVINQDGSIVIQPGFNAMAGKVHDFMNAAAESAEQNLPADPEAENDLPADPETESVLPEEEFARDHMDELPAGQLDDLPDEDLPPFDPAMGVQTPGFMDFCRKHNMNDEQIVLLVRKMEGLIYG